MERLSATQVVKRILPVFRDFGYDGASLSALSEACGLSRGSLYHHFPGGKQAMAEAVLSHSGAALARFVMEPLMRRDEAADKIKAMFEGVKHYYLGDPPTCLMNSLTLGQGRALFGDAVAAAVSAWIKNLGATLVEAGLPDNDASLLATATIERIQGGLILARVSGSKASFDEEINRLSADVVSQLS